MCIDREVFVDPLPWWPEFILTSQRTKKYLVVFARQSVKRISYASVHNISVIEFRVFLVLKISLESVSKRMRFLSVFAVFVHSL